MFAIRAASPDPGADFWYENVFSGSRTAAGVSVNADKALKLTAVFACDKVLRESVMQLPLVLYRRDGESRERATDHPLYPLLHDAPNEDQTAAEWREVMQHHLDMRGNAYAPLVKDSMGSVKEIAAPLHPDTVTIRELGGGRYRYEIRPLDGNPAYGIPRNDMLHLRALVTNGRLGLNPIEAEREAVGLGLAAQDAQGRFYANDIQGGAVVEHPAHFADDDTKKKFVSSIQASRTGANRYRTLLLEYGMKLTSIPINLKDAEFLASRKYQNLDICRIFRVPPHLIMELDRATFSNISSQGIEFVKFTLLPWFVRWEQKLQQQLLGPGSEYFFEFLVHGLERGDPDMRSTYYNRGIQDGWLTRNEVRARENLDPLDGLDEPLEPLNMTQAGSRQGAQQEPSQRFEAMQINAARSLARKQRHQLASASTVEAASYYLMQQASDIARIMACTVSAAERLCNRVAESWATDSEGGLSFDDWESRQIKLLMEL